MDTIHILRKLHLIYLYLFRITKYRISFTTNNNTKKLQKLRKVMQTSIVLEYRNSYAWTVKTTVQEKQVTH
jgi:hypothetical protein